MLNFASVIHGISFRVKKDGCRETITSVIRFMLMVLES